MIKLKKLLKLNFYNAIKFNIFKLLKKKYGLFKIRLGKIILDIENEGISKTLAYYSVREEDKLFILKKVLKQNDYVIDCGSNIGLYPKFISEIIGPKGFIACIEPDMRNVEILEKNLKSVKCDYKIINKAIGYKNETRTFYKSKFTNLGSLNKTKNTSDVLDETNEFMIDVINFKNLAQTIASQNNKRFSLLRMDIEGGEFEVFKSFIDNIEIFPNLNFLFENHPVQYRNNTNELKNIFIKMNKLGYKFKYIVSAGQPIPKNFKKFNIIPNKIIQSDFFERGFYEDIKFDHALELVLNIPKVVRYAYLCRD